MIYDNVSRHLSKKPTYYAYDDVTMPLTFFDSSVQMKTVGNSNLGWNPTDPTSKDPLVIQYTPASWEPPARANGGKGPDYYPGRFTFTRGALRGVDFGGGEVNTGQNK